MGARGRLRGCTSHPKFGPGHTKQMRVEANINVQLHSNYLMQFLSELSSTVFEYKVIQTCQTDKGTFDSTTIGLFSKDNPTA